MKNLETWLYERLKNRNDESILRELKVFSGLKDFCSNDYLGLARSDELYNLVIEKIELNGARRNGATGSRLISGNSAHTEAVEKKLANIFKSESALIFNSGYAANLAVLSSIPQKGDTILYDELVHTCIKDGARLSFAQRFSFKHNDLYDLEQKLKRITGKVFIAVESVYSMDGDACPLIELTQLAEKYAAFIILDEAHTTGVVGKNGSGLATVLGVEKKIAIRLYTFGKAMGCHGACVVGSQHLIQYLINFARPFIYTTALSPHSIASIECAFDFLIDNIDLQQTLKNKIALFNSLTENISVSAISKSAIQVFIVPGNDKVRSWALQLQAEGFDVRAIMSPTVKPGRERLRICLHTFNDDKDIISLSKLLIYTIDKNSK